MPFPKNAKAKTSSLCALASALGSTQEQQLQAYSRALARPLDDLLSANTILREDIQSLMDAFDDNWNDQTFRRLIIRACWAHIEAVVFGLKKIVLTACTLGSVTLSAKTQVFLSETQFTIDSRGHTKIGVVRPDTMRNVKLSLKLASQHFDVAWKPTFGTAAWTQLAESLELRHRITHPKSADALFITDTEAETHRDAFLWFAQGFNDFLGSLQDRYIPQCKPRNANKA